MGLTFKENCPDVRNTRVVDMVEELEVYGANIDIYDPWIDKEETKQEYGITPINSPEKNQYDAIILAVAHDEFAEMGAIAIHELGKQDHVLYDIKYLLDNDQVDGRL